MKHQTTPDPPAANGQGERAILSSRELLKLIPLSRATIWKMCREGRFPKPIQLSASRIGWQYTDVLAWIDERKRNPIAASLNAPGRKRSA